MTEKMSEKLSALMDGELDSADCPDTFGNKSLTRIWRRYHIISDIMHHRTPIHTHSSLSDSISQAIQDEPTVFAPSPRSRTAIIKPIAGLAVAASVAAIAILGIQNYQLKNNAVDGQTIQIELVSSTTAPLEYGVPVAPRNATISDSTATAIPVQLQIPADSRISRYILNHSEYQSNIGVQGMTPRIRLVATESNENE